MTTNRKPVQLAPVSKAGKRQQIWEQIRIKRTAFSVNDLYFALKGISRDAIRAYLNALVMADFLVPVMGDMALRYSYTLIKDCGVDAPRVRPDGSVVTLGARNENMWRTMKILKTFSWHDVQVAASTETVPISPKTARSYVEMLAQAGYLRAISKPEPGVKSLYRLVKNTGAQPPVIKRGGVVYDPNLGKVVYQRRLNLGLNFEQTNQGLDSVGLNSDTQSWSSNPDLNFEQTNQGLDSDGLDSVGGGS